jgi:hypothetical protein
VPRALRDDEGEPGLLEDGQLPRLLDHPRVSRDHPDVSVSMVVQREQELPIVDVGEAMIDESDGPQLDLHE